MKTDSDIKTDVYKMLSNSPLKNAVTGSIQKIARSPKSFNEDVIISVLSNDNPRQIQEAFVNVNVYVHDMLIDNNTDSYYVEDTKRVSELSTIIATMFENAYIGESFRITLSSQRVFDINATHEHCINNKLLYQCVNEK